MSNAHKYATRSEGVKSRARRPRVGACVRARMYVCIIPYMRSHDRIGMEEEEGGGREKYPR